MIKYQQFSSSTSLSLSMLNITQQIVLVSVILASMLIAGKAVVAGQMTLGVRKYISSCLLSS